MHPSTGHSQRRLCGWPVHVPARRSPGGPAAPSTCRRHAHMRLLPRPPTGVRQRQLPRQDEGARFCGGGWFNIIPNAWRWNVCWSLDHCHCQCTSPYVRCSSDPVTHANTHMHTHMCTHVQASTHAHTVRHSWTITVVHTAAIAVPPPPPPVRLQHAKLLWCAG